MGRSRGFLVAFEGADGSGKSTQARLLVDRLKASGRDARLVKFPRYDSRAGEYVGRYLAGDFGDKENLSPHFVALLYALDRFDFARELDRLRASGAVVVLDRYKGSNLAHQAARFGSRKAQDQFIDWLLRVESPLPDPALTFFLDVPVGVSRSLLEGADRAAAYRRGASHDQHESDRVHLARTHAIYGRLSRRLKWVRVACVQRGRLRSPGDLADELLRRVVARAR